MKTSLFLTIALLACLQTVLAFTPRTTTSLVSAQASSTSLYFFGAPKDDGTPGDYVCKVRYSISIWRIC
jgi:hypothetical protein